MIIKEIPGTQGYLATSDGRILDQDGVERNIYGGWLCVYKTPENIEALKMYLESPVP